MEQITYMTLVVAALAALCLQGLKQTFPGLTCGLVMKRALVVLLAGGGSWVALHLSGQAWDYEEWGKQALIIAAGAEMAYQWLLRSWKESEDTPQ